MMKIILSILKCTSAYPALAEDANLKTVPDIADRFGVSSGLSDHTLGIEAPVVAVVLGAKVIEKHFILNKDIGGPDAHFSLDETEFSKMVKAVRKAEQMMGVVDYEMTEKKKRSREFSRSLYIAEDVKEGELITKENVRSVRPGYGMHPKHLKNILGKTFSSNFTKGERMNLDCIHNEA